MTAPRVLPRLIVMLAAAVVAVIAGLPAARAEAPAPVVVVEGRGVPALGERMRFARDTGQDLAAIVADHRAGRTDPDFAAVAGGIVPYQPVWGTVTLTRPAAPARPDRAQGPAALILVPDIYGIVALDAWVVAQARAPVPLLAHSIHAPFDAAAYSGTRLAAEPFRLAPGETAVLVVRMTFGPLLGRHFALETPAEHGLATYRAGIALALYYALMAACILFFFLFNLSLGNLLGLGYSAMLGLGLGFVGYLDGLALRFLYPDAPGWHLTIGIALLMAIAATGFRLAAATMDALGGRAWLGRAMRLGGWLALGGMGATLVVAPEITAPLSYVLTVAMIGAQAAAAFGWRNAVGRYVQVNRGLALIAFLAATVLLVMLLTGWGTEGLAVGWVLKGIYAVIALLIMAGLSISLIDLRDAHEAALRRELDAVQKEAETNRTLLEAERNYRRARDLADLRRQQLATASHDIRQPLTSLRMTLDAIAQDQEPGLRARLERAFDYIEDLSGAYLAESRPDADAAERSEGASEGAAGPAGAGPGTAEAYPLSLVLGTAEQMFGQEAQARGLALRVVPSSVGTVVPAMVLLRIVGNIVSNAVKYTETGRVLVGVRRRPDAAEILVADTGPGLAPDALARLSEAWQKGATSTGEGLGLSICYGLAAEHGLDLLVTSTPGRGSCFRLVLPRPGKGPGAGSGAGSGAGAGAGA